MEAITYFTQSSVKKNVPELRPGDTVRVHQRIREGNKERIQIFEGVVMSVRGRKAINSSFVVRRVASGIGVEKTFPLHSPNVVKVERLKSSKVRQARLYYLRERFGRLARMRNEVRNAVGWEEGQAEAVEAAAESDSSQEPEIVQESSDEPETPDTTTQDAPVEEVSETPVEVTEETEAPTEEVKEV